MNTFNRKNMSVALLVTMGALFSINANAAVTPKIESSVNKLVAKQEQQMTADLSKQLQKSISERLNTFSIDFTTDKTITEPPVLLANNKAKEIAAKVNQEIANNQQTKNN